MEVTGCNGSECWTRSSDRNEDLLHIFLNSEMFDCSIKVIGETNQEKCHKVILSTMSNVFQAMFFGNFQEATKGPEDPITLKDVEPDAFEVAMRFIYGNKKDFKDVSLAIQVYMFAHRMQIISLLTATSKFLDKRLNKSNVLAIYDLYIITGNDIDEKCINLLMENSAEALNSECWLEVSGTTVASLLEIDLSVDEEDIFKALLRWGKAQVEKDGVPDNAAENLLRAKIDQYLKFIRFESMEPIQVAQLCLLTKILSTEEKNSIFLATSLKDPKHMLPHLAVENKRPIRARKTTIHLNYYKTRAKVQQPRWGRPPVSPLAVTAGTYRWSVHSRQLFHSYHHAP